MDRNCNNCNDFIPKSKEKPFNAFDYIAGNRVGVCNSGEDVIPLTYIISKCDMWEETEE